MTRTSRGARPQRARRSPLAGTALVATTALVAGSAVAVLGTATTARAADPVTAASAGAAWLAGELTDGVAHNDQYDFDDYGLTADIGLALAQVGGQPTAVQAAASALSANIDSYVQYEAAPGKTHVSAGSLAKALAFLQAAGRDDATTTDLVSRLQDRVSTADATRGRVQDVFFPEVPFEADFTNTLGQAYAVQGLAQAAPTATTTLTAEQFLLDQQCDAGYFRLSFAAATAADQGCVEASGSTPASPWSVDATAVAVLALATLPAADVPLTPVATAISRAAGWLEATQRNGGGFPSDPEVVTGDNANSTGLAAQALRAAGTTAADTAADEATAWVADQQVLGAASSEGPRSAFKGAIAYDDQAESETTPETAQYQWRLATAQALPALTAVRTGTPELVLPTGYVRAGSFVTATVRGLGNGQSVWARGDGLLNRYTGGHSLDQSNGLQWRALRSTGTRAYTLTGIAGQIGEPVVLKTLGRTTFRVTAPSTVRPRGFLTVRASGFAPGERVRIKIGRGGAERTGTATSDGTFAAYLRAGSAGTTVVRVSGQFADLRTTDKTLRVR